MLTWMLSLKIHTKAKTRLCKKNARHAVPSEDVVSTVTD